MLGIFLAALLATPTHATTTASLDSGWVYGDVGADGCGLSNGDVSASASLTVSSDVVADFTGFQVEIAAMHGGCEVTVDDATLYLDGTAIWTQSIGASGSGASCCEWYIDLDYYPSDLTDEVLTSGTHTLQLEVEGQVAEWGEQIAARVTADVEYDSDWDADGYDDTAVGGTDCDDDDAGVNPGASETWYDGTDQDCDGASDYDQDSDGSDSDAYGGTDCDDDDSAIGPSITETCDGVDNDCDGTVDEGDASDASTWYPDSDGDGHGDTSGATGACSQPTGYVADDTDCDDSNATTNPSATEYCNGADDDCDGTVDEDSAADASTWYADADGDGEGDASSTTIACDQPAGYVATATDCDDTDDTVYTSATEICNGVDDDCDGTVDEPDAADAATWYTDDDADGFGRATATATACDQPSGYVSDATDCDDTSATVNPDADELCNGVDDDCDGDTDEDDALDAGTWYADSDADGFGDPLTSTAACDQPSGFIADATDCDDADATVNPDATETWYDGVDQDCDGWSDYDQDADGWDLDAYGGDDCDDDDATINPDATEVWYDGVDQDCDGWSDYDADSDGFDSTSYEGDDCNDADDATYPGAPDDPYDGVINDCDAADEYDADGDGHDAEEHGGDDCDDANSDINPSQDETWYDGIDQDCDGNDDDQDQDGYALADDCDDTDASIHPGAKEAWYDGVDQDCDGADDYDYDGDGWPLDEDCDDQDPDSYPGAEGLDDYCNPVDTAHPEDTDNEPGDTAPAVFTYKGGGGCQGCAGATAAPFMAWLGLLGLLGMRRRG